MIGCPTPHLRNNTWSTRDGDVLTVHCNFTDDSWTLLCGSDGTWKNEVGNCSDVTTTVAPSATDANTVNSELPVSLVVAIAIGVSLGVIVGLLCLAVFMGFLRW